VKEETITSSLINVWFEKKERKKESKKERKKER
jgi:hypothetical protein